MGIFSRLRDIIGSNINAMLEKAEDPEKLIKLMIQEMEDTLVELKASCAGVMATRKRIQRELDAASAAVARWDDNAALAIQKKRDDLAREALKEKRYRQVRVEGLERELQEHDTLVARYQDDIMQLEEKLQTVREKQRVLVRRHVHARQRRRAQHGIRRTDTSDAFARFEKVEKRVDRIESEADLVNFGRKASLQREFAELEDEEEIEKQLSALKARLDADADRAAD